MSPEVILKIENLSAGYGEKEIIHELSFSLHAHTLTGLLGTNGCGKSTLLKSIANRLPYKGDCIINGNSAKSMSVKTLAKNMSYIPQKSGFKLSIPVLEMVLMGFNPVLGVLERPSKVQKKAAERALQEVGLSGYENMDFQSLSEGQKQLVFIARTMIENTTLMLLDEPESALDFHNRYIILNIIKSMVKNEKKGAFISLHDPMLALEFCDKLILMKDGRCSDIIYPQTDAIETMELALKKIYGKVSLISCFDKNEKRRLILIWEGV